MAGKVRTTLNMVKVLGLHLLLVSFAVIKIVEVADNDGHGQGNCQNPSNGTQGPHNFAPDPDRPENNKNKMFS
jgi:hypothetical protein